MRTIKGTPTLTQTKAINKKCNKDTAVVFNNSEIKTALKLAFGNDKGYAEHFKVLALNRTNMQEKKVFLIDSFNVNSDVSRIFYDINNSWDVYVNSNPAKGKSVSTSAFRKMVELGQDTRLAVCRSITYYGFKSRNCTENKFAMRNIVIDLDFHNDTETMINYYKNILINNDDFRDGFFEGVPIPSFINFTGRGFQFWWCCNEESLKIEWLFNKVKTELIKRLNKNIYECDWLPVGTKIDEAASKNSLGMFRLPGTLNSRTNLQTECHVYNKERYSIDYLKEALNVSVFENIQPKKRKKKRKQFDNVTMAKNRVAELEAFQDFCDKYGCYASENRHVKLHLMYNNLIVYLDKDNARNYALNFNNRFQRPLSLSECISTFKSIDIVGHYKYKNSTIREKLQTEEFFTDSRCNTYKNKRLSTARNKTLNKKTHRDRAILEMLAETGNVTKTAKICNVARNTVRSIATQNSKTLKMLQLKKRNRENRLIFNKCVQTGEFSNNKARKICHHYKDIRNSVLQLIEANKDLIPDEIIRDLKTGHESDQLHSGLPTPLGLMKRGNLTIDGLNYVLNFLNGLGVEYNNIDLHIALAPHLPFVNKRLTSVQYMENFAA